MLNRKRATVKFIANDEPRRVYGCAWPENSTIGVSQVQGRPHLSITWYSRQRKVWL